MTLRPERRSVLLFALLTAAALVVGSHLEPSVTWATPVPLLLLAFAAHTRLRRPAIRSDRRAAFPAPVERGMADAFGRLPMGSARDLLVRLVGAVEPVYRALERRSAHRRRREVHELVAAACRAAETLARLEHDLATLGDGDRAVPLRVERDRVIAGFRDGIASLQHLAAEPLTDTAASAELARLVASLQRLRS